MVSIPWIYFYTARGRRNKHRHGLDFVEAQAPWRDPRLLEIPARVTGEPRYLLIGTIGGKHRSAVVTYRATNIDIISVRRARKEEVALYEKDES